MSTAGVIADVISAFKQRGYKYVGKTDDGWFRLHGKLIPPHANTGFPCEVQIDPTFIELPRIRLLEIPSALPIAVPHLGADGEICYLARGAVVLDIYDPVGQSITCLEHAAKIFGRILNGEMIEDLTEEFFAYWRGWFCFVDMEGNNLGLQDCIVAQANGHPLWFITDNKERTTRKLDSLCYEMSDETVLTYRVETQAQPRVLQSKWPPRTVGDILAWQGILDSGCRRKIVQRIKEGWRKKANGVLIIIESPLMTYGFVVLYDRQGSSSKTKLSKRRDRTYGLEVMPMSVIRIDDRYLAERNIPNSKTLAGKNIAMVGCGTIGGYLSEMLVKAGAGTSGGTFTLVDFDCLMPQNIGRHRLGFPDLLANKAIALVKELKRGAPGAMIRALPVDVRQAQLGDLDLLIDATGEESLGHWLCGNYRTTPMLSVWIEGPGTAIRALLKAEETGACYRCLWHSSKRGEIRSIAEPLPEILAGHGCEGLYVPFPASVSMTAACLGAEMSLDWANGVYSPSLRTRVIDRNYQLATPDCDPPQDRECPLCNL